MNTTPPAWVPALAKRICNTWRGGPPLTEWIETLTELDEGTAGATYARLRNTSEHAPTIARFRGEYSTLDTTDAGNRADPCPLCDDHGWLQTRDHAVIDKKGDIRTYTQVQPCTCRTGRQAEHSRAWTQRTRNP